MGLNNFDVRERPEVAIDIIGIPHTGGNCIINSLEKLYSRLVTCFENSLDIEDKGKFTLALQILSFADYCKCTGIESISNKTWIIKNGEYEEVDFQSKLQKVRHNCIDGYTVRLKFSNEEKVVEFRKGVKRIRDEELKKNNEKMRPLH